VLRKRSIATVMALAAMVAAVSLVGSAFADDDNAGDRVLRAELVGNTPTASGGPTLFGVAPAGAPWEVAASDVDARRDGRIEVKVEGLVIKDRGTVGIPAVTASLYCGGELVGTTAPAPLSPEGDAEIRDTIPTIDDVGKPKGECLAPTVFVSPDGRPKVYFAVTGVAAPQEEEE
jgi:hypothetical protein